MRLAKRAEKGAGSLLPGESGKLWFQGGIAGGPFLFPGGLLLPGGAVGRWGSLAAAEDLVGAAAALFPIVGEGPHPLF